MAKPKLDDRAEDILSDTDVPQTYRDTVEDLLGELAKLRMAIVKAHSALEGALL